MKDYELLELAAKAAGYRFSWVGADRDIPETVEKGTWNPLAIHGDALRLAADLRIKIIPGKHKGDGCSAESMFWKAVGVTVFRDGDMAKQMCRAITMVAANIQIEKEKAR